MKQIIFLGFSALALLLVDIYFHETLGLHEAFQYMILFFVVLSLILMRVDQLAKGKLKVQMTIVKMVIRLLSALVFIMVLFATYDDHFQLVIQFFLLYLAFMTFEIIRALANLREN